MAIFYKCDDCGSILLAMGQDPTPCDKNRLQLLEHNTNPEIAQKHIPKVSVENDQVKVSVSQEHPSTPEHYVEWFYVETEYGGLQYNLTPGGEGEVTLPLKPEEVTGVYAYCGLHGLWKAPDPVLGPEFEQNRVSCSPEWTLGCVNPSEE